MIACEGQKAECYQGRNCKLRQQVEIEESGMLIEMFGEPLDWPLNILVWLIFLGVAVFLVWVGFIAAKLF